MLPVSLLAAPTETNVTYAMAESIQALKRLSLDELMDAEVTLASRRPERFLGVPSAMEVLTQDDIHRSGATSIPDVLRMANGIQVSRYGSRSYAIGTRGFTSTAANKLEVMRDGRSLYSPLFSGVFWEVQDYLLDDIDRIEVIRGPGATLWGANAVNGVINIVTKSAEETQGLLLKGGGGSEERAFGAIRYGGQLATNTFYRLYAKYNDRAEQVFPDGSGAQDGSRQGQGGFRVDSKLKGDNHLTVEGDWYYAQLGIYNRADSINRGGNVLGRWTHDFADDSELQLQMYYDRSERSVPRQFGEHRDTFDTDLQYHFQLGERQDIVAGFMYRASDNQTRHGGTVEFSPDHRLIHLASAFVQDEIALVPQRLSLVMGAKVEYNSLDHVEPMPSARLAYTPTAHQTVWSAVSRAVRTPTEFDEDLRFIPSPAAGTVVIRGNHDFKNEQLIAYELGYRAEPTPKLSFDVATYYHDYDNLRSEEPTPPAGIPLVLENKLRGQTYGVEISAKYQMLAWWRLSANYSHLWEYLQLEPGSNDPTKGHNEGNDAPNLFGLRSAMDLPQHITLDCDLRYVDALPHPGVPAYMTMDVRLGWRPTQRLEVAVVGQNLLQDRHREWGPKSPTAPEVQRGIYGELTLRF